MTYVVKLRVQTIDAFIIDAELKDCQAENSQKRRANRGKCLDFLEAVNRLLVYFALRSSETEKKFVL